MFPVLSSLNSILPFLVSSTAWAIFIVTVPAFGDGISPFGPSCLATGAKSLINSGVVIKTSKSVFPSLISLRRASCPAISAPAFFASSTLSSVMNTATFLVFPVPWGRIVVALSIWSLYFGLALVFTAISIPASNLA